MSVTLIVVGIAIALPLTLPVWTRHAMGHLWHKQGSYGRVPGNAACTGGATAPAKWTSADAQAGVGMGLAGCAARAYRDHGRRTGEDKHIDPAFAAAAALTGSSGERGSSLTVTRHGP